jgi:hypothetical protein
MIDPRRRRLQPGRFGPFDHFGRNEDRRQIDVPDRLAEQRIAHGSADDARRAVLSIERAQHSLQILVFQPAGPGKARYGGGIIHGRSP